MKSQYASSEWSSVMARKNTADILSSLGKGMQDVASSFAKGAQDVAGAAVNEGGKAIKKGATAVSGAAQGAADAVKNQQVITPEQMQSLLDIAYSKSLDGIPNVSKGVEELANDYAKRHATADGAAVSLINNQLVKCTTSGALSSLAGVISLPATLASISANVTSVIYMQMRMVAALAVLGGYDVHEDQVKTAVYICMAGSAAADVLKEAGVKVGNKVTMNALKALPGSVLTAINQKVGFRLATKFGETGIVNLGKLVPVVGAVIGGGFDFATTRVIATTAYNQFIGEPTTAVEAQIVDEPEAEALAEGDVEDDFEAEEPVEEIDNHKAGEDPGEEDSDAVSESTPCVEVGGVTLSLPDAYQKLDSLPGDAPGSVVVGMETEGARCFLMAEPICLDAAMPFDDDAPIIDGIHEALDDEQGLVEVEHGVCESGHPYVYSIVKTALEPAGVQYAFTFQVKAEEVVISIKGFFDEVGTTGARDAMVYSHYRIRGSKEPWTLDPYDPERTTGNLMNLSERAEYDAAFPGHPLSLVRGFVAYVVENN